MTEEQRLLQALAETAYALSRPRDLPKWIAEDVLRQAWAMCQARGVQPGIPPTNAR